MYWYWFHPTICILVHTSPLDLSVLFSCSYPGNGKVNKTETAGHCNGYSLFQEILLPVSLYQAQLRYQESIVSLHRTCVCDQVCDLNANSWNAKSFVFEIRKSILEFQAMTSPLYPKIVSSNLIFLLLSLQNPGKNRKFRRGFNLNRIFRPKSINHKKSWRYISEEHTFDHYLLCQPLSIPNLCFEHFKYIATWGNSKYKTVVRNSLVVEQHCVVYWICIAALRLA